MEYYSAIKNNEILPFAATWMALEGIMLNKSDRERQILYGITYLESKKYNKLVNKTKRMQTHRYKGQTSGYQWRWGKGVGKIGVWD